MVNDLDCRKGFKRVPEAAQWLQGTELKCMFLELTKQAGLLCSLVGEKEASTKRERERAL